MEALRAVPCGGPSCRVRPTRRSMQQLGPWGEKGERKKEVKRNGVGGAGDLALRCGVLS